MSVRVDPLIVDIIDQFFRGQEEALVAQQDGVLEALQGRGSDLSHPEAEEIVEYERDQLSAEAALWRTTRTNWGLACL